MTHRSGLEMTPECRREDAHCMDVMLLRQRLREGMSSKEKGDGGNVRQRELEMRRREGTLWTAVQQTRVPRRRRDDEKARKRDKRGRKHYD